MQSQFTATVLDQLTLNTIKILPNAWVLTGLLGGSAYLALGEALALQGLARSNAIWNVLSTMTGAVTGYAIYNEQLTPKHLLGIGLGVISLYLLNG